MTGKGLRKPFGMSSVLVRGGPENGTTGSTACCIPLSTQIGVRKWTQFWGTLLVYFRCQLRPHAIPTAALPLGPLSSVPDLKCRQHATANDDFPERLDKDICMPIVWTNALPVELSPALVSA